MLQVSGGENLRTQQLIGLPLPSLSMSLGPDLTSGLLHQVCPPPPPTLSSSPLIMIFILICMEWKEFGIARFSQQILRIESCRMNFIIFSLKVTECWVYFCPTLVLFNFTHLTTGARLSSLPPAAAPHNGQLSDQHRPLAARNPADAAPAKHGCRSGVRRHRHAEHLRGDSHGGDARCVSGSSSGGGECAESGEPGGGGTAEGAAGFQCAPLFWHLTSIWSLDE